MSTTTRLTPLKGSDIKKTGYYLCHPVVAFEQQPLLLVKVFKYKGYLCYWPSTVEDDEPRVVTGSGYTFFEIPKTRKAKTKKK